MFTVLYNHIHFLMVNLYHHPRDLQVRSRDDTKMDLKEKACEDMG